jgi:hypothetical protein
MFDRVERGCADGLAVSIWTEPTRTPSRRTALNRIGNGFTSLAMPVRPSSPVERQRSVRFMLNRSPMRLLSYLSTIPLLAACGGAGIGGISDAGDAAGGVDDTGRDGGAHADRFLFCSARTGNFEIYRYDEGTITQLTDDASYDSWWPRISPDRSRVAFYRSRVADRPATGGWDNNYAHAALWLMDAGGAGPREILTLASQEWQTQGVAGWSPDGRQLIMTAQDASTLFWGLWNMTVDEGTVVRVSSRDAHYFDPSWSPDGERIVFAALPPEAVGPDLSQLEIYTASRDGSDEVRLTDDSLRDHDPSWSPGGSTILFETEVNAAALRWALRTVGASAPAQPSTLLDDGNINTLGRWRPDGALTFHRFLLGAPTTWRISRIESDGTGLADLTDGSNEDIDADPF